MVYDRPFQPSLSNFILIYYTGLVPKFLKCKSSKTQIWIWLPFIPKCHILFCICDVLGSQFLLKTSSKNIYFFAVWHDTTTKPFNLYIYIFKTLVSSKDCSIDKIGMYMYYYYYYNHVACIVKINLSSPQTPHICILYEPRFLPHISSTQNKFFLYILKVSSSFLQSIIK